MEKFDDAFAFMKMYGHASEAEFLINWEENNFYSGIEVHDHDFKYFFEGLPQALEDKLRVKFGLSDEDDILEASEESFELRDTARMAIEAGYQSGTSQNHIKAVKSFIDDILSPGSVTLRNLDDTDVTSKEGRLWDTCHTTMPLTKLISTAQNAIGDSYNAEEYFFDRSKHRAEIDWDYDEKAAHEYLEENM